MKKVVAVLALAGLMMACNSKKKEDKGTGADATTTTTTDGNNTAPAPAPAPNGVPTFSDPAVQQFVNDYAAFMEEYKSGMKDPAKLIELSKRAQEWSTKSTEVGMKLATNPQEAKAFADWMVEIAKSIMPAGAN